MFHWFLKKSRTVKKNLFLLLFLVITLNFAKHLFQSPNKLSESTSIVIKPGMRLSEISDLLYDKKIIENKFIFKIWIKINSLERKLKFGEFFFERKDSVIQVANKLYLGEFIYRKITIIEGSFKYDLISKLNFIDPDTKITIEDIPDEIVANTYNYHTTDDAERILENIIKLSNGYSAKIWDNRERTIPIKNISEMFTLASIVEKETALKKEKPKIAGVFYNRLKKKMRLQSDPTVEFSITKGKNKLNRKLYKKDLKFKSEYNTYVNHGLPPSAICFPGLESLRAVSRPYHSNFFYFVSKNLRGEHFFSTNYKEHLENIKAAKNAKK